MIETEEKPTELKPLVLQEVDTSTFVTDMDEIIVSCLLTFKGKSLEERLYIFKSTVESYMHKWGVYKELVQITMYNSITKERSLLNMWQNNNFFDECIFMGVPLDGFTTNFMNANGGEIHCRYMLKGNYITYYER